MRKSYTNLKIKVKVVLIISELKMFIYSAINKSFFD